MAQENKNVAAVFQITVLTGDDAKGRICDFCRQSNRNIIVRGSNNDDRDICGDCILSFDDIIRDTKPDHE
jgi:hypothetical protein